MIAIYMGGAGDVKLFLLVGATVAVLFLISFVVVWVQHWMHRGDKQDIIDRFEKRGKYADERWPHER